VRLSIESVVSFLSPPSEPRYVVVPFSYYLPGLRLSLFPFMVSDCICAVLFKFSPRIAVLPVSFRLPLQQCTHVVIDRFERIALDAGTRPTGASKESGSTFY